MVSWPAAIKVEIWESISREDILSFADVALFERTIDGRENKNASRTREERGSHTQNTEEVSAKPRLDSLGGIVSRVKLLKNLFLTLIDQL